MKQLEQLCALVRRWNPTVQLVSAGDLAALETRHVLNSLTLLPVINQLRPDSIVDIGSGGGFPGLVVAIMTGIPVHLVEADRRKAEFLREAVRQLGLMATVHAMRASMLSITADIVTARAVAPLPILWAMARPLLAPQGIGLFLKGASVTDELRRTPSTGLVWPYPSGTVVEMRE